MIDTAPAVLDRTRHLVEPALMAAVARLHPELRRPAEYHFGWVDAEGTPTSGGGKGVRPALAVLSAEAVGAAAEVAVPGAVAMELVHNFSLIHDDIMDGDRERRHRPTVWAVFGIGQAVIVGDALHTLAHELLLDPAVAGRSEAAAQLAEAVGTMIGGQADDMAFESRDGVELDACLRMAAAKTGALLACSSSIGAVLAGAAAHDVGALRRFGDHLGLAFQAVDDLLGIWGATEVTGKPVGSDLASKKKTIPVAIAMRDDLEAAEALRALFRQVRLDPADVARATHLLEQAGAREATDALAHAELRAAEHALGEVALVPAARAELMALAHYVCERQR